MNRPFFLLAIGLPLAGAVGLAACRSADSPATTGSGGASSTASASTSSSGPSASTSTTSTSTSTSASTSTTSASTGTGSGGAGGGGGDCKANSPSGIQCDPWSAHLYMSVGAVRVGTKLHIRLRHDPDMFEGSPNDFMGVPAAHQYYQSVLVEVDLATVSSFYCNVFTKAAAPAFDAKAADFLTTVDNHPTWSFLAIDPTDFTAHVDNLIDLCGSQITAFAAPKFAVSKPSLSDVGWAVPLVPDAKTLQVGDNFVGWPARGYLTVDEESEMPMQVTGKVLEVVLQ